MVVNGTNRAERPVFEHKHIRTADRGLRLEATGDTVTVTDRTRDEIAVLFPNDAIRLAAWLNRWFKENNFSVIQAENAASKAKREQKGK